MASRNDVITALEALDANTLVDIYRDVIAWDGSFDNTPFAAQELTEVVELFSYGNGCDLANFIVNVSACGLKSPYDLIWCDDYGEWYLTTENELAALARDADNVAELADWLLTYYRDADVTIPADISRMLC